MPSNKFVANLKTSNNLPTPIPILPEELNLNEVDEKLLKKAEIAKKMQKSDLINI